MMVSGGHNLTGEEEETYTDSELGEEEEEGENYSDEADHEFENEARFVPKTFEDFQTLFKSQFEPAFESEEDIEEEEPLPVDRETEKRVEQVLLSRQSQEKIVAQKSPEPKPMEVPASPEEFDQEDYEPEELELSGECSLE